MSKNFYKNLPKKRTAAGALIFNSRQELLIVKPTYKDHWSIPGGCVDENESIQGACIREVREEIGIDISSPRFLCVDYMRASGDIGDSLQFIFYGGLLSDEQIKLIKVDGKEIGEFKFLQQDLALPLLSERLRLRILKCSEALTSNLALYLENGNYV